MEDRLSPAALTRQLETLASGEFLTDPIDILDDALDLFRPPVRISTLECAERFRKFRTTEGGALVPYDRWQTPYNIAKMEALDDPTVERVIIVKPSRSGGTAAVQNYLFKMMLYGPMGDVGWYLGSDAAVKQHAERSIGPMFEDHPDLRAKLGTGRSDNNETSKRVRGHLVEWMAAKDGNFRDKEFLFMVMDEPDGWTKFSESPETQMEGRQKRVGRRKKGAILSHPDKGWKEGVAPTWVSSSRGIYVMRCAECEMFAAAYATKYWPGVPEFRLDYTRNTEAGLDERLALAEKTAGMACPHCGAILTDEQRHAMIDEAGENGWWMHRGQTLDPVDGIQGEPEPNVKRGFWDHGLMLKVSTAAELASGLEEILFKFERSGGRNKKIAKELREYMSKQLGEIFEGKSGLAGLDAGKLKDRTKELARLETDRVSYRLGEVPDGVMFITLAVDVGGNKFDILVRGWDLQRRSWIIDRRTIRQRMHADGVWRDIAPSKVQEDWTVLEAEVDRLYPLQSDPGRALPVACTVIDASDGNVTWKAYEFARRMDNRRWGVWQKVRCIKGSTTKTAPPLPPAPTKISKDSEGRLMKPVITLHVLGVYQLKEDALDDVAIVDGAPGQVFFPVDMPASGYEEVFNEPLVDGEFVRNGPNETLDLLGYTEAARLMLQPDRKGIVWSDADARPVWAQAVSLEDRNDQKTAEPETASQDNSILSRFDRLNGR